MHNYDASYRANKRPRYIYPKIQTY